jgi:soluble lytic murein transglycosylase-like protein
MAVTGAAEKHGIPRDLVAALVRVESAGQPWAFRFEPAFLRKYVEERPRRFGSISIESERIGRATSWGLLQIMGQVARERGFASPYLSELCAPETGLELGCRHLAWLRDRHLLSWGWPGVTRAYNTGRPGPSEAGNVYEAKVLAAGWRGVTP